MARLIDLGAKENQRRRALSKFALCIDDAVVFRDHRPLVNMLKSGYQLTTEDHVLLADYLQKLQGRLKRKRGRPRGKPIMRFDWLASAALEAEALIARWRRMRGGARKVALNGSLVNIRTAVCERIAAKYGHPHEVHRLETYLNRMRSRR